jgi:Trk-type K+ transport systems, membrane components
LCTGLSPIADIGNTLSVFGKIILTLIIQIGGLGFVTIVAYIMMIIGVKVGIEERQIVKEALNQSSIRGLMKFVKKVILITLIAEGVGVILYSFVFMPEFGFWTGLGYSIFHSVSAFNNCGFDLLGDNSFINYSNNILLNLNVMYLIIVGGIGFIVINDLIEKNSISKKQV